MQTLIKKFTVNANENILLNKDILQAIEINFGKNYSEALKNDITFAEYELTILFNADTKIKIKSDEEQNVIPQDTIDGVFIYPFNYITKVISTSATSGTLLLKVK